MDFIDASNNNSSPSQQQTNTFCPSCDGRMLYVTRGNLAENYVCESCGTTIDPKVEYVNHESELIDMSDDESNPDMLSIVQKQDPPK
jgi:DNA-directed RNA polymerase subunit M/transcription elongation factor TFIIS